jgi:hypothetical protein
MYWSRISRFTVLLALITILIAISSAQEVAFLDLTKVAHRDLRRPESKLKRKEHYSGAQQVTSCLDSPQKVGALRTSLLSLDRTYYQVADEPIFEVTVENVGSTALRIPFSPNLADLQPEDAAQKFAYSELRIALWIASGDHWATNTGGLISLYGNEDHANTIKTLSPGERVRVIGKGDLFLSDDLAKQNGSVHPADQFYAQASLFHDETLITTTQSASVLREVCISQTHGQSIPIQLAVP